MQRVKARQAQALGQNKIAAKAVSTFAAIP
jgi:hypothetical protein